MTSFSSVCTPNSAMGITEGGYCNFRFVIDGLWTKYLGTYKVATCGDTSA